MEDLSLVLYNHPALVDYGSFYLTWYDSSNGDGEHNVEPLSSSQDGPHVNTYYLTYEEGDYNYTNGSQHTKGASDQDYGSNGSWLEDYASYFGGYWGINEAYFEKRYEESGKSLEKEQSSVNEGDKYGGYYNYNNDTEHDYSENQWLGFDDFHDYDSGDFSYCSSWDDWEDMELYERIFGH